MDFVAHTPQEAESIREQIAHRPVLFKTVFGSNLYGTNTPLSDKDYKAVFLPSLEQLLSGKGIKNIMQKTNNSTEKNTSDDVDFEWIPLQVFARDFIEGQTYALELAFAATSSENIECEATPAFVTLCEELIETFLTSNIRAMMGYALGQAHKYGIKGSRLGSVKKFEAIIKKYEGSTSKLSELPDFLSEVKAAEDKYLFFTTYEPYPGATAPAISLLEKVYPLDIPMTEAVLRTNRLNASYGKRAETAMAAEGVDWKAVSHAVRISYQALDVLMHHKIVLPFDYVRREYLLFIKQGLCEWTDVENHLAHLMDEVDLWKSKTTLPEKTPELTAQFEEWLLNTSIFLYNLEDYTPAIEGISV